MLLDVIALKVLVNTGNDYYPQNKQPVYDISYNDVG